ncbi:MAG: hypothetical protein ACEPOZ_06160 [Marinifilaceae bacterium]
MPVPTTYLEWSELLDQFGKGDNTALDDLNNGNYACDSVIGWRFCTRVYEAFNNRIKIWLDKFESSFHLRNFRSFEDYDALLKDAKQNLTPLFRFIELEGLPKEIRSALRNEFQEFLTEFKKSMIKNVPKESNNKERILFLLNAFSISHTSTAINTDKKYFPQQKEKVLQNAKRKILL